MDKGAKLEIELYKPRGAGLEPICIFSNPLRDALEDLGLSKFGLLAILYSFSEFG